MSFVVICHSRNGASFLFPTPGDDNETTVRPVKMDWPPKRTRFATEKEAERFCTAERAHTNASCQVIAVTKTNRLKYGIRRKAAA